MMSATAQVQNTTLTDLVHRWRLMAGIFRKVSLCLEQLHRSPEVLREFERLTETLERLSGKTLKFIGKQGDPDLPTPTKHTLVKILVDDMTSTCENIILLLQQEGMEEDVSLEVRKICAKMRGVNAVIKRSKFQVPELATQLRVCLDIVRHEL